MNVNEIKSHHAEKMGECLAEVYVAIYQEVALLHLRWGEYLILYGGGNDRIEVMNKTAPNFFGMIQTGLQENITLHIARLIDPPYMGRNKDYKNLSIKLFPELIKNDKLKEKVEKLICLTAKAVEPCKDLRDKWHAHRDRQIVLDPKAKPLPTILRRNIDEPINAITKILDVISTHYHNTPTSTIGFVSEWSEAQTVLEILDRHIRTQQDAFKAKRAPYEKANQSASS